MRNFIEFLQTEYGVNPTLTAGHGWQFPTTQTYQIPTSFHQWAQQKNMYEKPHLQLLHKIQLFVQNAVSDPASYNISPADVQGDPRSGGTIRNLNYQFITTPGTGRLYKFNPVEIRTAEELGIFRINGSGPTATVDVDLGRLYNIMASEIRKDYANDALAASADTIFDKMLEPSSKGLGTFRGNNVV